LALVSRIWNEHTEILPTNRNLSQYSYWKEVMCVGSVDRTYGKASYSNHGHEIDFLAPGSGIVSLGNANDYARAEMSGCSMTSPHVAGMAAIFVSVSLAIHSLVFVESIS
jgi:subtilisin family serine protease